MMVAGRTGSTGLHRGLGVTNGDKEGKMVQRVVFGIAFGSLLPFMPMALADGGDTSLIHACVHQDPQHGAVHGRVRIVLPNELCKHHEAPVHWSIHGSSSVRGIQLFASDGTFTVPAGVSRVLVEAWGGGGAGGNGPNFGGGGGGGGYVRAVVAVNPGQAVLVTVGQGGAPGCGLNGLAGGDTTFGGLLTAGGGQGGTAAGAAGAGGPADPAGISSPGQAGGAGGNSVPGAAGLSARGTFAPPGVIVGQGGIGTVEVPPCNLAPVAGSQGLLIVQW
jgi:hypothetical protein